MKSPLYVLIITLLISLVGEAKVKLSDKQERVLNAVKVAFQLDRKKSRKIKRAIKRSDGKGPKVNFCEVISKATSGSGCQDQGLSGLYLERFANELDRQFQINEQLCVAKDDFGTTVYISVADQLRIDAAGSRVDQYGWLSMDIAEFISSVKTMNLCEDAQVAGNAKPVPKPVGSPVMTPGQTKAIMLVDDFEDANFGDWAPGPGTNCSLAAWGQGAYGNSAYSMLVMGSCNLTALESIPTKAPTNAASYTKTFGPFQASSVNVDLSPGPDGNVDTFFEIGAGSPSAFKPVIYVFSYGDRWFMKSEGGVSTDCGPAPSGTWQHLNFAIDWNTKTITLWVDNNLRASNVGFYNSSATTLETVLVRNQSYSWTLYDNIILSSPPPQPSLIFRDGFESGDTSRWSATVPAP
jgi:hypothetical protein